MYRLKPFCSRPVSWSGVPGSYSNSPFQLFEDPPDCFLMAMPTYIPINSVGTPFLEEHSGWTSGSRALWLHSPSLPLWLG